MIDYLYLTSRRFRRAFDEVPKISCYGPHLVHDAVTLNSILGETTVLLRSGAETALELG